MFIYKGILILESETEILRLYILYPPPFGHFIVLDYKLEISPAFLIWGFKENGETSSCRRKFW